MHEGKQPADACNTQTFVFNATIPQTTASNAHNRASSRKRRNVWTETPKKLFQFFTPRLDRPIDEPSSI